MKTNNSLYRSSKNYRNLHSYQKVEAIYDITCFFCEKFLRQGDRTTDKMLQAARSGKRNIIEGCEASAFSAGTEIKLIGVAKESLHELWTDYGNYLRKISSVNPVKGRVWEVNSVEAKKMYELSSTHNDAAFYMKIVMTRPPETIANIAICLLRHTDYLLAKLLETLKKNFSRRGICVNEYASAHGGKS